MPIWEKPSFLREYEAERGSSPSVRVTTREGVDQLATDDRQAKIESWYRVQSALTDTRKQRAEDIKNGKNLDEYTRRGAEGTASYLARRDAGLPPKNEWDDPNSPYNRKNIEEGLMMRENNRGVEYGVLLDKNGEVMTVAKGIAGQVSYALHSDSIAHLKGGELTHNHPSQNSRPLGACFSTGDLECHYKVGLEKIRAIAVEGDYQIKGQTGTGNKVSMDTVARMNDNQKGLVLDRVRIEMGRLNDQLVSQGKPPKFSQTDIKDAFYGEHYVAVATAFQKEMVTKSGYEYSFKAKKGFEHLQEVVDRPITNVGDTVKTVLTDSRFRTGDQLKKVLTRDSQAFKQNAKTPFDENGDTVHLKNPTPKAVPVIPPKPAIVPATKPSTVTPPKTTPTPPAKPPRTVKPPKPIKEKPTDPRPSKFKSKGKVLEDLRFETVVVPT
jgi:hypothetical protein